MFFSPLVSPGRLRIDLALKPNETRLFDVAALQSQKLIPADASWASVVLNAPVNPDELMAVATSFDQTLRYGAQTPFNDQLAGQWEAGMWEVDSTHDSLVTVTNGGDKPVHAELTILYNHGTEHYRLKQSLAPDEQMLLDFGKLIHDQIADSDGHTLPPDLMMGTYRIKDLSDPGRGSLYEGKITVEKTAMPTTAAPSAAASTLKTSTCCITPLGWGSVHTPRRA